MPQEHPAGPRVASPARAEREPQEGERGVRICSTPSAVLAVHDPGFGRVQSQPDLFHPVRKRRQDLTGLAFGRAVHDRVVGITLELHCRGLPRQPHIEGVMHEQVRQHGETEDPCGVPRLRCCKVPSGNCSGALSQRFTYSSTHGASVCASTALTMRSHRTLSKNLATSRSITQSLRQHRRRQRSTACNADRRGRYPVGCGYRVPVADLLLLPPIYARGLYSLGPGFLRSRLDRTSPRVRLDRSAFWRCSI
jgi:hypothetical protein